MLKSSLKKMSGKLNKLPGRKQIPLRNSISSGKNQRELKRGNLIATGNLMALLIYQIRSGNKTFQNYL